MKRVKRCQHLALHSIENTLHSIKKSHHLSKEPYIIWKEPNLESRESHIRWEESKGVYIRPCIRSKVPYIRFLSMKRALILWKELWQKSPNYADNWGMNICSCIHGGKRALHTMKRSTHSTKRALHSMKRALHSMNRVVTKMSKLCWRLEHVGLWEV